MKRAVLILCCIVVLGGEPASAQAPTPAGRPIPYLEGFEGVWSEGAPEHWSKEFVSGSTNWTRSSGGWDGHPPGACSGEYNALLFREDWSSPVTRLITPRLEFGLRKHNTRLAFRQAMENWFGDQDELAVYYKDAAAGPWELLASYRVSISDWTERSIGLPEPSDDYYVCFEGTANYGYGVCIDDVFIGGDSSFVLGKSDYDGDGTVDRAIYRPAPSGGSLWAIDGLSRIYFGTRGDIPVAADYDGDGTTEAAIFRPATGLWVVRGQQRYYYGATSDIPVPADYDGDGCADVAIFRPASGMWSLRGITRLYCGAEGDIPVPGDWAGDGRARVAIFRSSSGYWNIDRTTRIYFGHEGDTPVPADYDGDGVMDCAVFRPTTGLWSLRKSTEGPYYSYWGSRGDEAVPADYDGDGVTNIAVFRPSTGLWAVRGISRAYFGSSGDIPVTR